MVHGFLLLEIIQNPIIPTVFFIEAPKFFQIYASVPGFKRKSVLILKISI
jgi:hypothetical protein